MRIIDADALKKDGGFVHEVDNAVYWEQEDIDNAPTLTLEDIVPHLHLAVSVAACEGCAWSHRKRPQKCSCCRRNLYLKDCYEEEI